MTSIYILSFILIQILFCASAQKQRNIKLGSTLFPSQNSKWVSPNGQFAFGFYPQTPTLYVLGVWFDNMIPQTLAWTVIKDKKDIPIEKKSSLQLTDSGLRLFDDQKNLTLWSSDNSDKVAAAAMLDNGNFVLLNALFEPIWQSFDSPTDTLLPGQTLVPKYNMFSKASATNFSAGRFELSMQWNSNLVLYAVERRGDSQGAYWASGTDTLQDGLSLKFDPSGLLYFVNSTNVTVSRLADGKAGDGRFLRRVTLEIDGTFAQYVWNMDGNDSSWSSLWQPVKDPCNVKGQCGNNGICRLTDQNKPDCICPRQFNYIDLQNHFKGCTRSSSPGQSCRTSSTMLRLDNTDWMRGNEADSDYTVLMDVSEFECQQSCLNDCMCVVVTYNGGVCRKKRLPLFDGRQALEINTRAFVKVYDDFNAESPFPRLPGQRKEREGKTLVMIGIILLGCSSSFLAAAFLVAWLCGSKLHGSRKITQQHKVVEGLKAFPYREIDAATAGFTKEIGRGSFGKVYKGELPDGRAIAVKSLHDKVTQEEHGEKEFRTEMSMIGTSHHKNLVQLYGFCDEGSHRLLVYEYMNNGSLDAALFVDTGFLDWRIRVQIAMGTARGLLYLHEECRTQILHCDIKPQNILLDQNYSPKISDFGLAKLLKADQTATFTAARGTKGYIAPEWINKMPITVKVDVYSFGVMLLEIICCRKTLELGETENKILLSDWVYECLKHDKLSELVEQQQVEGEGNIIDSRQLARTVLVGLWCVQEDPALRPSIKKVLQMMEGTVEIAVPPPPGSFVGSLSL